MFLPGAMGVKCALPDRPVLCFTGDGGIYYHLTELETAARHGINLVVLVNNNSSLNQEIPLVKAAYKEKRDDRSGEIWRFSAEGHAPQIEDGIFFAAPDGARPASVIAIAGRIAETSSIRWSLARMNA